MSQIADANALVSFVKDFTGSKNDAEIKECIFMAEMMLRNIELPVMRSDPYNAAYIGIADANGQIAIPGDMLKPIIFFKQGGTAPTSSLGPWLVYDRVGDRDIITEGLIESMYLKPINIPSVYRGKFSEVGNKYSFLPALGQGDEVNLYYYRSWANLFSLDTSGNSVLNNGVLQTFPEGYVYSTLHCYYVKRKSPEDAVVYKQKFDDAWKEINDQNNKGKWSGGHTRMTSIFQPRKDRRFTAK
jgi:hypothetical protein